MAVEAAEAEVVAAVGAEVEAGAEVEVEVVAVEEEVKVVEEARAVEEAAEGVVEEAAEAVRIPCGRAASPSRPSRSCRSCGRLRRQCRTRKWWVPSDRQLREALVMPTGSPS